MPVSDAVRSAEQEIDTSLSQLPIWRCARDNVLNATLDFYKGAYLTLSVIMAQAAISGGQESVTYVSTQLLQRLQAGCFQTLKWAFLWCPERSSQTCSEEMICQAQEFGAYYEGLVDSLKLANYDLVEIVVDESSHQVTVYEGGDVTGVDWSLVAHQRHSNLYHSHFSLTEDSDQLTRAWTAGPYRRTVSWLASVTAQIQEPVEVYKRNQDLLTGIAQARERSDRLGSGAIGVVITDGYRGDYVTWRSAIDHGIPIGTLEDIPDLARDPRQVFDLPRVRVGFESEPPQGAPFEKSCKLVDWTLRLVDSKPIQEHPV
jgi:hypothetical protein